MSPPEKIKRLLPECSADELAALGTMIRALVNLHRGSRELAAVKRPKKRKAKRGTP